jgi:hypothetical protein
MGVSGQLHAPAALPPGKEPPRTHWIGGCVGPRAYLDDVEKIKFFNLPGLELRPFALPGRNQSLSRLLVNFKVPLKRELPRPAEEL